MVRFAFVASILVIAASAANAQLGPVCEEYFAKEDDCVERLPEFMQEDHATINAKFRRFMIERIKKEGPAEKKSSDEFCRNTMESLRKAKLFYEYGCRWTGQTPAADQGGTEDQGAMRDQGDAEATGGRVPGSRASHPRPNRQSPKPRHTSPRPARVAPHAIHVAPPPPPPPLRR
jgi:hypothetical protein